MSSCKMHMVTMTTNWIQNGAKMGTKKQSQHKIGFGSLLRRVTRESAPTTDRAGAAEAVRALTPTGVQTV